MKKLLIPVLIAVLAGVGGGSGFAYMRASKAYVADSTQLADSLKAHPPAAPDSLAPDSSAHESTTSVHVPTTEVLPMTPADSIRAVEESRASLHGATKGLPDAAPPTPAATATPKPDPKHAEPAAADPKHPAPAAHVDAPKPGSTTASVANIVRDARNEAMNTALPEQRLSKIFAAMSAKDAAKVMEQMPDADVRAILAMMSDRTAAAVLSQFPAARAAAITKGAVRVPESKP
ncbi:MAG: hypothetical protein IPP90_22795 [Gemmatimonadaceae bacterium]|nr:hypothetical protein [Gemmatimonadaceae bacterium]